MDNAQIGQEMHYTGTDRFMSRTKVKGIGAATALRLSWSRVVHLDVEVRSDELLAPALLCHKEPARASKAP